MRETWWYWVVLGCYSYGQWGCETCKKKVGPVNVGLDKYEKVGRRCGDPLEE